MITLAHSLTAVRSSCTDIRVCVCVWLVPLLHTIFIHLDTSITYNSCALYKIFLLLFFGGAVGVAVAVVTAFVLLCFRYSIMHKKWSNSYLLSNLYVYKLLRAFYAFWNENAVLFFLLLMKKTLIYYLYYLNMYLPQFYFKFMFTNILGIHNHVR